jgi:putative DNA primase/helicase
MGAADVAATQAHLQRIWAPRFSAQTVEQAMVFEAGTQRFHPVREWLDSLQWGGKERLDTWLSAAFGAADTPYHRAVGAKMLIAAVRRVRQPGVKFDYLPVLEGNQGIGKSRAVRCLFSAPWFSDALPHDLASRDGALGLLGMWGIELGEIDQLVRTEVETVKAFPLAFDRSLS